MVYQNPHAPPSIRGMSYAEAQQSTAQFQADQRYQGFINSLGDASVVATIGGSVVQAIGAFYAVKAQQDQLKSQALSLDFAEQVAEFNSNMIQQQAARVEQATQQQVGLSRMRGAEAKASARASAAARGVKVDSGSAAETERAIELMSQIDAMTIEANGDERVSSLERSAVDQKNRGMLAGVSARNVRSTARSLSPAAASLTSQVGNAGRVAGMFYDRFGRDGNR